MAKLVSLSLVIVAFAGCLWLSGFLLVHSVNIVTQFETLRQTHSVYFAAGFLYATLERILTTKSK